MKFRLSSFNLPEKWLHNWIATGPNKSKKLTRLTSPAHTLHGKVRINPLEIWVVICNEPPSNLLHSVITLTVGLWCDSMDGRNYVCSVFPSWPPCIAISQRHATRDIVCEAMYVCCFSFKLCRVYCVSVI